jgi:uncharacterized SAM-binding protein YcdF (DUF218 family)
MRHDINWTKNRRLNGRRLITVILLFIPAWFFLAWIAAYALIVDAELHAADAIVVLSGSSTYKERTSQAAELYRIGRAPIVVLTDDHTRGGWSSAQQRNPFFVERAHEELTQRGVPADRIRIAPGLAASTHDEAVILKDYVTAQGLRSVLIVTSAYHSRRALRTVRLSLAGTGAAVGIEPVPPGAQTPSPVLWWLHGEGWRSVAGEYAKLIYYRLKYG